MAMACAVSGKDYRSLRCLFNWIVFNLIASEQVVAFYVARPSLSHYLALSLSLCLCVRAWVCVGLSCLVLDRFWLCFVCVFSPTPVAVVHSTSAWGASTLAQRNLISKGHVWCRPRSVPAAPTSAPPSPPLPVPNHRRALRVRRPSAEAAGSLNLFFLLLHRLLALSLSRVYFKAKKHVLNLLIFHSHTHKCLNIPLAFFIHSQIEAELHRLSQSFSFVIKSAIAPGEKLKWFSFQAEIDLQIPVLNFEFMD